VTTCLITTLSNNHSYVFTVTATNEVGESDPSAASAAIRPDVKPNPPGTPVAEFGDKQVSLSWAPAEVPDGGSPVRTYTVQVSPGGSTQQVTGTSMVWSGLTNGTAYTFRVQAHNDDPNPSNWSASSVPVVPAGAPFQPAAPQTVKDPVSALAPSATVSWTAPNGNGDNNLTYEMRRTGGTVLYSGTGRSAHVTLNVSTTNQTFEVRARNKAGWGDWSPASNGVRGWQTPGAVTGLSSAATGANNQVRITFGAADGNGATAAEMKYYWRANGVTGSLNPGTTTVTNAGAFPNGQNVSVAVYAVSTVSGESVQGSSTSTTVNPYGPPTSPSVSCSTSGNSVNCSWSGGNANGRTTSFQVSGDWSTSNGGASGSHGFGDIGYSASRSLCVQAVQDGGATGARNNVGQAGARQGARDPAGADLHARRGAPAARGRPRHRQDRAGRGLAATVQGSHSRIQFTPDLLPSDVTGVTIYDQQRAVRVPQGPDLRHDRAGRRDQPGLARRPSRRCWR
jgi:hypothetical protein